MRLAVLTDIQTAVRAHHFEIRMINVIQPILIVRLADAEHAEVRPKSQHTL